MTEIRPEKLAYCLNNSCTDCPEYYTCENIDQVYDIFLSNVEKELQNDAQDAYFCPKCVIPMEYRKVQLIEDTAIPTDDFVEILECPKCHHTEVL
jgi:hypothetical protein